MGFGFFHLYNTSIKSMHIYGIIKTIIITLTYGDNEYFYKAKKRLSQVSHPTKPQSFDTKNSTNMVN